MFYLYLFSLVFVLCLLFVCYYIFLCFDYLYGLLYCCLFNWFVVLLADCCVCIGLFFVYFVTSFVVLFLCFEFVGVLVVLHGRFWLVWASLRLCWLLCRLVCCVVICFTGHACALFVVWFRFGLGLLFIIVVSAWLVVTCFLLFGVALLDCVA